MSQVLVSAVSVMVTRDPMTILPATVGRHELPILHAIFGDDNVREMGDAEPFECDTESEVQRMENKYGPEKLEEAHGKAYKSTITAAIQAGAVKKSAK